MTKKKYLEIIQNDFVIMGEFKNEHGEQYVVSHPKSDMLKDQIFVAGDETDWEAMQYFGGNSLISTIMLSEEEVNKLKEITKKE